MKNLGTGSALVLVVKVWIVSSFSCSKKRLDHLPFKLPVTNSFIRSLKANLPRTRSERQMWPSEKPVSRQQYSGDIRINKPNNSLKCHHHCTKYKFEVKTPTLREFSRIKNRVFHSVTVRKNNQLNNANIQHKKCSRNIYVVKFSFPKYKSVVFAA